MKLKKASGLSKQPNRLMPVVGIAAFISLTLVSFEFQASTAQNTVPNTRLIDTATSVTFVNLIPNECAGILLDSAQYISAAAFHGTAASELILGTTTRQTLAGAGGDDCIIGGAGDDSLNGGAGVDVCIGGPGTDIFNPSCETQIQGNQTY